MIDLLLERYLNTYRWEYLPGMTNDTEVFVNPSRKEILDSMRNPQGGSDDTAVRFILDDTNKQVYVWGAFQGLHSDMWGKIRKDIGDSRKIYHTGTLLMGVYTPKEKKVTFESKRYFTPKSYYDAQNTDWSWSNKWIPNTNEAWKKLNER